MTSKLPGIALICCTLSYAMAGTSAIGTASARGDMRVDGYAVKGNATLFDGTVVETGQNSAALHLQTGVEVNLATETQGTFYSDKLVLQRGSSELTSSGSFQVEANGLRISSVEPNSKGTVSVIASQAVEVAALTGEFKVTSSNGYLIAKIRPGAPFAFGTPQAVSQTGQGSSVTPAGPIKMALYGNLTHENWHFYLHLPAPDLGVVYELIGGSFGGGFGDLVGHSVIITGVADLSMKADGNATAVIQVSSAQANYGKPSGITNKAALLALLGVSAAGIAIGFFAVNNSSTPASR